jgi:hypothetical protein
MNHGVTNAAAFDVDLKKWIQFSFQQPILIHAPS